VRCSTAWTSPVPLPWFAGQRQPAPAGWCAAIAFKERTFALNALQGMGKGGVQVEGTIERRLPSGDLVWGAVKERHLLLASSRETLLAAGHWPSRRRERPWLGRPSSPCPRRSMARSTGQSLELVAAAISVRPWLKWKRSLGHGQAAVTRIEEDDRGALCRLDSPAD